MARSRSRIRSARLNVRWGILFASLVLFIVAIRSYWSMSSTDMHAEHHREIASAKNEVLPLSVSGNDLSPEAWQVSNAPHSLDPVLNLANRELAAFSENVLDYTAVMHKRERIGGKLGEVNQLFLKIINRRPTAEGEDVPLHSYLRFESPSSVRGREVIWVEGKNDGNMIAHEAGLMNLMSVKLSPTGSLAMMGNKYPITGIGMGNLFSKLIEKGERDRKVGECDVTIREHEQLDGVEVVMIEVKHPVKQAEFDFHIARIYLDTLRHLPVRYESYLWPTKPDESPPLEEQYSYSNIQLNVGLTEADFDPENEGYSFP